MQTTFRLKASELPDLMTMLKALFKKEKEIEITVSPSKKLSIDEPETKEEYRARINKAIEDAEKGKNLISFTAEEFEKYSDNLSAKHKR